MENELEGLAEPVRRAFLEIAGEAVCVCHEAYTSRDMKDPACNHDLAESVGIIRAELIRLARENAKLQGDIALSDQCGAQMEEVKNGWIARAHRAESELAALRKRVADAPVMRIDPVGDGAYWSMADGTSINELTALNGKRVRLVEESV